MSKNYIVYAGTYTTGSSEGIYTFNFNSEKGTLEERDLSKALINPSYITTSQDNKILYAVLETGEFDGNYGGAVTAFSIDGSSGKLSYLNYKSTAGQHPCHVITDSKNKYVFAANYSEGTVTAFSINKDGSIGDLLSVNKHEGNGPNRERQEKAHVHFLQFTPDEKHLCAVDLGIDKVVVYDFDDFSGGLSYNEKMTITMKPGAGPRHLVFHPNRKYLYVINELSSEIAVFEYSFEAQDFKELQYISTLPEEYAGNNLAAAIRISEDGRFIYVSNRGHDSIAIFRIMESGKIQLVAHVSSGGKAPRDFAITPDGEYLLAANQDSNNIVVFKINKDNGFLTRCSRDIKLDSPVSIRFVSL